MYNLIYSFIYSWIGPIIFSLLLVSSETYMEFKEYYTINYRWYNFLNESINFYSRKKLKSATRLCKDFSIYSAVNKVEFSWLVLCWFQGKKVLKYIEKTRKYYCKKKYLE